MFEHKIIKWLVTIIILGILTLVLFFTYEGQGRFSFQPEQEQEYITATIDSTIQVYQLNSNSTTQQEDTFAPASLHLLVARVDSDSLVRYDLHRHEQERVNIDMEEHKEAVFFTWDDIKAYFHELTEYYKNHKNKQSNDDN